MLFCQSILTLFRNHQFQYRCRQLPAFRVLLKILVQSNMKRRICQKPAFTVLPEIWKHNTVHTITVIIIIYRNLSGTAYHSSFSLAEHLIDLIIAGLRVFICQSCIRYKLFHIPEYIRPHFIVEGFICHIRALVGCSPHLTFKREQFRNRHSLKKFHACIIIGEIRYKSTYSIFLKLAARQHETVVVRRQRDTIPVKKCSVGYYSIHFPTQRQPVHSSVAVSVIIQICIVKRCRSLGSRQIHQLILQPLGIMQRKPSVCDYIRKSAVILEELIEVKIIITHCKLNIIIRKMRLDIWRIIIQQSAVP